MFSSPLLVLASASPYKRRLMRRLGVDFTARDPDIDESRRPDESPRKMAQRLAVQKAEALATELSDAWILGADQVAALGDRIFEKPKTRERAIAQLQALQGTTHELITAVALVRPRADTVISTSVYDMTMRPLTTDEIAAYVNEDDPVDCAGSYKIEKAGIRLFEAARGDDPTAIEGLPLTRVWTLLLEAGSRGRSEGISGPTT